jgi:hypothetical protein
MDESKLLSSDLSFVKEFEELRLKQKLLIESLKKRDKTKEDDLLTDINTKLDFLVTLFEDAKDDHSHEEYLNSKFQTILEKIENMDKKFEELKVSQKEALENLPVKKLENLEEKKHDVEEKIESVNSENPPQPIVEKVQGSNSEQTPQDSNSTPTTETTSKPSLPTSNSKELPKSEEKLPEIPPTKKKDDSKTSENNLPPPPDFSMS